MTQGAGLMPFGSIHCGFGIPSQLNSSTAKVYIKRDGTQGNAALIDPKTGDYVLDEFGNTVGDDSINQMVYLAFNTLYNSSSVPNFGFPIDISNSVITDGLINRIKLAVFKTVKHMTDAKVITIISVNVKRATQTGLEVIVQWRNNSTNEINVFTF